MDRYNRRWVSVEEHQKLQTRLEELATENEKLKNRNDLVRELIGLLAATNRPYMSSATGNTNKTETSGSLQQFVELAKDLSNDIRNIMKSINRN
jgi:hypothetical protein